MFAKKLYYTAGHAEIYAQGDLTSASTTGIEKSNRRTENILCAKGVESMNAEEAHTIHGWEDVTKTLLIYPTYRIILYFCVKCFYYCLT